jgi:hypothetical protein
MDEHRLPIKVGGTEILCIRTLWRMFVPKQQRLPAGNLLSKAVETCEQKSSHTILWVRTKALSGACGKLLRSACDHPL